MSKLKLLIKIVKTCIKQNGCFRHALGNARHRGGANSDLDGVWVHNDCFLDKPKQKVNTTQPGDIVRTPDSHPDDFVKLRGGQKYKNKNTNEIWEKSRTSHSDKNGEWKVGLNGRDPIDTKKITIGRSDGKVIKFNGK